MIILLLLCLVFVALDHLSKVTLSGFPQKFSSSFAIVGCRSCHQTDSDEALMRDSNKILIVIIIIMMTVIIIIGTKIELECAFS